MCNAISALLLWCVACALHPCCNARVFRGCKAFALPWCIACALLPCPTFCTFIPCCSAVIEKERKGAYLGKTVQMIPHISGEIVDTIVRMGQVPTDGSSVKPQICLIELGGTVGDIESMIFLEALRTLRYQVGHENFCLLQCSLIPNMGGVQKTKPTQHTVKELLGLGLQPDVIVCRCDDPVQDATRAKISQQCGVSGQAVLSVHNVPNLFNVPRMLEVLNPSLSVAGGLFCLCVCLYLYLISACTVRVLSRPVPVPLLLTCAPAPLPLLLWLLLLLSASASVAASASASQEGGIMNLLTAILRLDRLSKKPQDSTNVNTRVFTMADWEDLADKKSSVTEEVSIAIVAKYTEKKASSGEAYTGDTYMSVIKALDHASLSVGRRLKVVWVDSSELEYPEGHEVLEAAKAKMARSFSPHVVPPAPRHRCPA